MILWGIRCWWMEKFILWLGKKWWKKWLPRRLGRHSWRWKENTWMRRTFRLVLDSVPVGYQCGDKHGHTGKFGFFFETGTIWNRTGIFNKGAAKRSAQFEKLHNSKKSAKKNYSNSAGTLVSMNMFAAAQNFFVRWPSQPRKFWTKNKNWSVCIGFPGAFWRCAEET